MSSTHPLAGHPRVTTDADACAAYAADASGLSRVPDAVARPESEEEVAELLRLCAAQRIPITPQGLRSSMTGAAVAEQGIVLSLEKLNRMLHVDPERRVARAEPGIVTAEFKRQVGAAGLFYPVDPTSEEECTLGGTVACNASGSRTYRYGPTRRYVRSLRVALADGRVEQVARVEASKNAAGFFGLQNPIDLWIGSEGTLGVVTQVEVDLLPAPPGFFGAMAFFSDWRAAVEFIQRADGARRRGEATGEPSLRPRCLELFDHGSLDLIRPEAGRLRVPPEARAAVFFEEEAAPEEAMAALERWAAAIAVAGAREDETIVALDEEEQAELRRLRHALPAGMNERGAQAAREGGRKVSTDFAVPLARLPRMLEDAYDIVEEVFGGAHIAYGHAGNGHPHFNLLAANPEELARAEEAARRMARRARELGGTLSAEHGIGKVKLDLFRELYPPWVVEAHRAIKRALDPTGILAPGNLIPPEK